MQTRLTQDGVGEKLLLERGVPGVADDEGPEDGADASTRSSNTNGGSSGSNELGSRVNVLLGSGGVDEVGGLHGGGPHAPPGGHAQAGRDGETGNGGHDGAGVVESGRNLEISTVKTSHAAAVPEPAAQGYIYSFPNVILRLNPMTHSEKSF